ncbi:MAG: hypothetical protein ABFS45_15105 [Pseudomonadota bacterium]
MLKRTNKGIRTRSRYSAQDPLRKMHRHLAWALGTATSMLVVNAVAVIALVEVC